MSIGRYPRQIQRRHGLEQMIATDRAKAMGEREIKDDTHPQFVGHVELF